MRNTYLIHYREAHGELTSVTVQAITSRKALAKVFGEDATTWPDTIVIEQIKEVRT